MPVLSRLISIPLRIGEIAFAAVVAGIIGSFMRHNSSSNNWPHARFIYSMVIAALSMLLGLVWLIPFSGGFVTWIIDVFMSAAWFASFALMVMYTRDACNSGAFDWGGITNGGTCNRWRAVQAFAFLSAVFWLVSALVGVWFTRKERRDRAVKHGHGAA